MGLRNEEFARNVGYDAALVQLNHLEYLMDMYKNKIIELTKELDNTQWSLVGYEDSGFRKYNEIMRDIRDDINRLYELKDEYIRLNMLVIYCNQKKENV